MKYLLDTNICVHFFRGNYNLGEKFQSIGIQNCAISEITLAELAYGAENSGRPKKNHKLISDFTSRIPIVSIFDAIPIYAKEKSRLKKDGNLISDFDILIGATAVSNGMILITENVKDFKRIQDLKIENWVNRQSKI